METGYTENRNECKPDISDCVIYGDQPLSQLRVVLTTQELLRRLADRGVKNADIARALNITPSRVTEMHKGLRAIKLDEAAKLVEKFDLESEPSQRVSPLPAPVAQLLVEHVALQLGHSLAPDSQLLAELSEDLRAFAEFVSDPKVRGSIDLAMAFFQALRLRRPGSSEAYPAGSRTHSAK